MTAGPDRIGPGFSLRRSRGLVSLTAGIDLVRNHGSHRSAAGLGVEPAAGERADAADERPIEQRISEVVDCREYQYRGLPAEVRKFRNPGNDEAMAEWIRSLSSRSRSARDLATLERWDNATRDAWQRATTLVGSNNAQGYGFDSANSSPIGRYAMFEIRSSW